VTSNLGAAHMTETRRFSPPLLALAALACAATAAGEARAEPQASRVAVLVGANLPAPGRERLLFGHDDARKMAGVLTSVAGFRKEDVFVLRDPNASDLLTALQTAADRLADRPESLLYFYYSGHADEQALYPAGQPLPLNRLRAIIDQARVSVRIGMVDACHGGAWTRAKGLRPDEPFPVRWPLTLETEGSVLIASSSGLESAHESDQLRGSFFTHHFASGLRGAADRNGNGQVTITEAFEYAKERTIRDTLRVAREAQHPSFAVNLRGRRDLVLAQISQSSSTLELSQERGPLELVHLESGVALLELPEGPRSVRLAVPPGIYLVRKKFPGSIVSSEVAVRAGLTTRIEEADLTLVGSQQLVAKSVPPSARTPAPAADLPDLPEASASGWVKLGAVTTTVVSVLSLALSFKFALDINTIAKDLDPYRRYTCADDSFGVNCDRSGTTRLRPVTPDETRYVGELQDEGKRYEGYQYKALTVGLISAAVSALLYLKWARSSNPSPETEPQHALDLAPTWLRGPGFVLNARF
jgi:hypothetical protein